MTLAGGVLKIRQQQPTLFEPKRSKSPRPSTLVLAYAEKTLNAGFTSVELTKMIEYRGRLLSPRLAKRSIQILLRYGRILKQVDERGVPLFRDWHRVFVVPKYFSKEQQ